MKTLSTLGVSLLAASMELVATVPVYAAGSTAASLSAVFASGSTASSTIGPADTASVSVGIESLSVSAAAGAQSAVAGGYADATNAVSIGGAVEAGTDLSLKVFPTSGLDFASPVTTP